MEHKMIKYMHWYAASKKQHFVHHDAGKEIDEHIVDMLDTFEPGSMSFDAEKSHTEKVGYIYFLLENAYKRGISHGKDKACLALTKVILSEK